MKNEGGMGWREAGDADGLVLHLRVGASVLCRTPGAKAATTERRDVNCAKCRDRIARIWPRIWWPTPAKVAK